jgi:hypothetical protein
MATEGPFLNDGSQVTAAADLSAKQFYAVKLTGSRQVNLVAASTDTIYGILQNKPKSGDAAEVVFAGICKAQASNASITAGDLLMVNSSGQVLTRTSGNTIVGQCIETGAANQIVTMIVWQNKVIT